MEITLEIAITIGSTRSGRLGEAVGKWAHDISRKRNDADFGLIDIAQFNLPLLDEPMPATSGHYSQLPTRPQMETNLFARSRPQRRDRRSKSLTTKRGGQE